MKFIFQIVIIAILFQSCDYIKKPKEPEAIARVGDDYLYKEDIATLVPNGTSKNDSIAIVKDFINRWATQKLLYQGAELNLSKRENGNI